MVVILAAVVVEVAVAAAEVTEIASVFKRLLYPGAILDALYIVYYLV